MTFDSVAAVQTRIAQIQQLISGSAPGVGGSRAPAATSTQSPEFASLLADAMGTGTSTDPLSGLSAPSTDASGTATGATSMVSQLMKLSQLASNPTGTSTATASNATTQLFISNAMAEKGKPYVYGATASISDPNPRAFDCSELTKWAAARAGVTIPDGATAQYLSIRDHGRRTRRDQPR